MCIGQRPCTPSVGMSRLPARPRPHPSGPSPSIGPAPHLILASRRQHRMDTAGPGTYTLDLVTDFAKELPMRVIATVLGLPQDAAPSLRRWADIIE